MKMFAKTLPLLTLLAGTSALATGERITLSSQGEAADQLRQTLCISMECVADRDTAEAMVSVKASSGSIEVKVVGADGQLRLTHRSPAQDGRFSATDLVSATSKVFQAIESPQMLLEQKAEERRSAERTRAEAAEKKTKAKVKKAVARKASKKKAVHLAAR